MSAISFPTSPIVGQQVTIGTNVYTWDGTVWRVSAGLINISIDDLTDVDTASGLVNGQVLQFNGTSWVPQTPNINFLSDVDTVTSGPTTGQVLRFNGTNWVPGTLSSASVSTLTDATITSPSDGQILRYSTSTSKWVNSNESISSGSSSGGKETFRNRIVNGDFRINQRESYATVQPTTAAKFPNYDRWYFQQNIANPYFQFRGGLFSYIQQPGELRNTMFLSARQVTAIGGSEMYGFYQDIEAWDLEDINIGYSTAKPMVLSFWARSNTAGEYPVSLNIGTSHSFVSSFTITAATAADSSLLQYFTIPVPPFTLATINTFYSNYMMTLCFGMGVGANYRTSTSNAWVAGNYYANTTSVNLTQSVQRQLIFSKVQLEKGTTATDFEVIDYATALQKCRRYFFSIDSLNGDNTLLDRYVGDLGTVRSTTTQGTVRVVHPVRMRARPVVTQTGGMTAKDAGTYTSTATLLSQATREDMSELTFTLGTAGTALRPIYFYVNANSGKLEFSAE